MKNFSVFKRYETGERASRLYLKNLVAKVTSEQVMERKTINIQRLSICICICCFFAKHAALRRKSKDWLAQNQDNVSAKCCLSVLALFESSEISVAQTFYKDF
jgi:hypothetical protein